LGQINWDDWVIGFFVKNPNYPITQLIVLRTLGLSHHNQSLSFSLIFPSKVTTKIYRFAVPSVAPR
jgi:hypothetical protein